MKGGIFTVSGLSETLEWSKKLNLSCDLLNLNLNQDRNRHHPRWLRCKLYVDTVRIDQHDSLMAWVTCQGITCALSVGNYLWDTLIIHCLPKFSFCKYVRLAICLSICSNIKSRITHERFDMSLPNLNRHAYWVNAERYTFLNRSSEQGINIRHDNQIRDIWIQILWFSDIPCAISPLSNNFVECSRG